MPFFSGGGGGGGAAFNGGTITNPLTIAVPLGGPNDLAVTAADFPNASAALVIDSVGGTQFTLVGDTGGVAAVSLIDQDNGQCFLSTGRASLVPPASSTGTDVFLDIKGNDASTSVLKTTCGGSLIVTIPTADPHIVGALYSVLGTVHVSAGP